MINIPVKRPSRAGRLTLNVMITLTNNPRHNAGPAISTRMETLVFEPGSDTAILALPLDDPYENWLTLPDEHYALSIENAPPGFRSTSRLIIEDNGRLLGRPDSVRASNP